MPVEYKTITIRYLDENYQETTEIFDLEKLQAVVFNIDTEPIKINITKTKTTITGKSALSIEPRANNIIDIKLRE